MYELNKERFGAFVAQLRKEQGLTQQALAEKLYTTNKAVSKWERGVTVPDVSMLIPLAEALDVSVTDLLQGSRLSEAPDVDPEDLVKAVIGMSERPKMDRKKRGLQLLFCAVTGCVELWILTRLGVSAAELSMSLATLMILMAVFGSYFCVFALEKLPDYYDSHRISHFADGMLRINMPGVYINNRNWPYIVRAVQLWAMLGLILSPALYLLLRTLLKDAAVYVLLALVLAGLIVPMVWVAKKYEFAEGTPRPKGSGKREWVMFAATLALLGALLVGLNAFGFSTYSSGIKMGYRGSITSRSWEASYGYHDGWQERRVNIDGNSALLHIQAYTTKGTLTVLVTDQDGTLLFSQETAEDATWEVPLNGPARVRFTLESHSGGFAVSW